jgi:5-oxoprolinase (ATP-hydrolysing) subunit A
MMDINCDLGEGEPLAKTRRILRWVTSANIACGGHAGSERTMRACLKLCHHLGVNAGAHPGFEDRKNFGRKEEAISLPQLQALIGCQAGRLSALAEDENIAISHIKLHGALYHVVEHDKELALGFAAFVKDRFAGVRILASPNGEVIPAARRCGVEAWGELFSDRAYNADGELVPRSQPGAILRDLAEIRTRIETFRWSGRVPASNGKLIPIAARTVCIHADSPAALRIARMLATLFREGHTESGARSEATLR